MRTSKPQSLLSRAYCAHAGALSACQPVKRADWRCVVRYAALRELIPSKEKSDKATFLQQVVEYVRALQVRRVLACIWRLRSQLGACSRSQDAGCAQGVLQQLMESGTVSKLPEDLQWSIRLLVPRRAAAQAAAPAPAYAAPALSAAALPAQAEAPALAASGVAVGQGVGSVIAQQARRPRWPCSTATQHAVGLSGVTACVRRRPWRSCTCYSSWLHRRPRGCRHSRRQCHWRRLPCLPAVRCVRLHAHEF